MKILSACLLALLAGSLAACSSLHLVHRNTVAPAAAAASSAASTTAPAKVAVVKPLPIHAPEDATAALVDRIVARVVAVKRNDQRIALPAREEASPFERRLLVLLEEGLTKAGFHIPPPSPLTPIAADRVQLAVLNVETSLTLGAKPSVEVIAHVVDRGDVVLACVESLPVSPRDFSLYQPTGTYVGRDQNLHENPVKNFKIIRGE